MSDKNTVLRFVSWNINGIRATLRKGTWEAVHVLKPDIYSIQEIKATNEFMDTKDVQVPGYSMAYEYATIKKGYSGVATYTSNTLFGQPQVDSSKDLFDAEESSSTSDEPALKLANGFKIDSIIHGLGDPKFDEEGRLLTHLISSVNSDTKIAYINGYYPQGGRGPHRVEYKIEFYKKVFDLCQSYRKQGYGIILCGDFNTTVGDIDLARPKENRNTTGCLPEERVALNWFLQGGYVDTFRHFYADKPYIYSYWDQITRARERNVGWRIDYFIVSDDLIGKIKQAYIWNDVMGSDHCPVGIDIVLT